MAVKSKTALGTDIDTKLASASDITASEHRGLEHDIVDSYEDFVGSYTTAQIASLVGMTLRQRVFNTTDNDYEYYDGTRWVKEAHPKYKLYKALLTQTGTNAPVATVLENTLGGTVVWARTMAGLYTGTLSGAFTSAKTFPLISNNYDETYGYKLIRTSDNVVTLSINDGGGAVDDALDATPVLIEVYY